MKAYQSSRLSIKMLLSIFLLIFLCQLVSAQEDTAVVRGVVVDSQNRTIPNATVKIINPSKGFERIQSTNDSGDFVFNFIPPNAYQIEVEAPGFKRAMIRDVDVRIGISTNINVQLEAGNIHETVTVSANVEAPLNTTDAALGNTFESQRIERLPLNARNIVGLLSLQPGVARLGEVNGGRRDQANLTLDGIDNNEQQTGLDIVAAALNDSTQNSSLGINSSQEAFAGVLRSTPESVQEFRVTTSGYNANQGRSSGAQVSLVTKSGTNQFHGSLFEFHRNTATTANDFFNNAAGRYSVSDSAVIAGLARAGDERVPRPKLIRNVFGGALGGPIIKDRLFFFYTYEGRRDASEQSVLRTVPTATLRQGIVRYERADAAGQISVVTLSPTDIAALYPATGGVNPNALSLLQTAPLPNDFSLGDGFNTAGFRFNAPISTTLNTHIARFDLLLTDRQSVFFRSNYQQDLYELAQQFPTTPRPKLWVHPSGFVVGHTWTISNNVVNNTRVGFTRQAFSLQGDSNSNLIEFRFVYQPFLYQRTLDRTTPVWNITDDVSWNKGTHTLQFGANTRFIRNNRRTTANSFDSARVNPFFYAASGAVLLEPLSGVVSTFDTGTAIAAVLGRLSQYSVSVNYDRNGNPLPPGAPSKRSFATEEYEFYVQDSWKARQNLTIIYGLRWGVNTPVYERNGFEVKPTVSLSEFFDRRVAGAANGHPVNDPITLELSGKANHRPGLYNTDWNNFAPSIGIAWSPDFGNNFLSRGFGRRGRSVLRGGFRVVYDHIGSALAVNFDLNNALGFSSESSIAANTFNVTTNPPPLFTNLNQSIRNLPLITLPGSIRFPLTHPSDQSLRIERGLDDKLTTPVHYMWNVSYGRELQAGLSFETSYIGRMGRKLITSRDIMHLNNLRDPVSGSDWYTAIGRITDLRNSNANLNAVAPIPYFENLFPGLGASLLNMPSLSSTQAVYTLVARQNFLGQSLFNITDYTLIQYLLDDLSAVGPNAFFHPQYAALAVYSTIGQSDYHGATFTLRQRFKNDLAFDINYTFSKSIDTGSNFESQQDPFQGLIINPLDPEQSRGVSNFDVRHNLNANWLLALPFGKGKKFLGDLPSGFNTLLSGWQLSGILRFHTGLPVDSPFDVGRWATNWNSTSRGVRIAPVNSDNNSNVNGSPNIFSDPVAAYRSYRNARAGESGDRNPLRLPSYFVLDAGLSKTFSMGYAEGHELEFRWEVFNVTNTQPFGIISTLGLDQDPYLNGEPPADFGRYVGSQTPVGENRPGRVMQFALRYRF